MEKTQDEQPLIQQNHRSTLKILFLTINASLGAFLMGYMMAVYNPLQDALHSIRNWDEETAKFMDGIITASFPIGCMFGSLISGKIIQSLGRYKAMIMVDIFAMVSILITLIDYTPATIIGRVLTGAAAGVNSPLVPIYIYEMVPEKLSGQMGALFQALGVSGVLVSFFLGFGVPNASNLLLTGGTNYWRLMFAFPLITCSVRIIVLKFVFPFETPSAQILNGNEQQAEEALNWIYYPEFVQSEMKRIREKLQHISNVSYKELFFSGKYNKRITAAILLSIIQQLSGNNAILFYSTSMFKDGATPEIISKIFTVFVGILLFIGAIWGGSMVDEHGRKIIMLYGQIGIILTLFLISLDLNKFINMFLVLSNCLAFGSSMAPIVWLILPEIVPDAGVSSSCVVNWLFVALIGFSFPILKESSLQLSGTFRLYAGMSCVGLIYIYFMIKETKGQTQQQIAEAYEGKQVLNEDKSSVELTDI